MSQLSAFNAFNAFQPQPNQLPASAQPQIPQIDPETERTLLEKLGSAGLHGLGLIGGALEKPGRAVRGLLGGNPREALNLIPFSDALGITDPSQRVTGHQLLKNVGIASENDPSLFSPEGAAGFGVDLLTDPLSFLSFGSHALTKAGQIAQKANVLPKTITARLAGATPEIEAATKGAVKAGERLGGHIGVGIPGFGNNLGTYDLGPLGSAIKSVIGMIPGGQAAMNITGKLGSTLGDFYNRTIPPLFQSSVLGQTDPIAQAAARNATEAIPGAQAAARAAAAEVGSKLPQMSLDTAGAVRSALESKGAVAPELQPAVDLARQRLAENLQTANYLGRPDMPLNNPNANYFPRQQVVDEGGRAESAFQKSLKPAGPGPAREQLYSGLRTEEDINKLTSDPNLLPLRQQYNAGQKGPFEDYVRKNVVKVDEARLNTLQSHIGPLSSADAEELADLQAKYIQSKNVANWVATSVPESLAHEGIGFFGNHPVQDLDWKLVKDATPFLKMKALHESVAGMANFQAEGASLKEVLTQAGLTYKDANGNMTAMQRTLEAMQRQGKIPAGATLNDLADWTIPYNQVDKLTKFTKASTTPEGLKPFLGLWDSITNLTKGFQTTIWPANKVRTAVSGMFQNWITDGFNAQASGPMKYLKPFLDANVWRNGGTIEGASKYPGLEHLTDEAATHVLASEIKHYNVGNAFRNPEAEIIGGDVTLKQRMPEIVGEARPSMASIIKSAVPRSLEEANPFNVAGVGGRTQDVTSYVRAGRELGSELHAQNRVATYLAKRSQGFTPEAALQEVKLAHYDFSNMTGFEKSVMQRVIPFYSFLRQNVPAVLNEITENPGGKLATVVKGATAAKGERPGFTPPQISAGIAAPLGVEESGQQRYLTHLGLGFEQLGDVLGPGGPLSALNPLIKAPVEVATGRQLISGRDLADLHSRISDTTGVTPPPLVENLLTNSPLGRIVGTASTLEDPRKSMIDKLLNTLTGARVSDVDVEKSRRAAVLDAITQALHGPGVNRFESLSVNPATFPQLSPQDQRLYQLYRALQSRTQRPQLAGL